MFTQLSHFYGYSFAMVAIQSIHLITSLVNCLSYIFYRYFGMPAKSDGNVPWSWKTAGFNCILLCFWIKNRFFHDLVALFIVVYSNNNNSCAFWIPYHLQLWGCCNRLPCQISYYNVLAISETDHLAHNLIMLVDIISEHIHIMHMCA